MYLNFVVLALAGGIFGIATSAGMFALLIKLGVVPRVVARFHLANYVIPAENVIMLGTLGGCVVSLCPKEWVGNLLSEAFSLSPGLSAASALLLGLLGLGAGVFVGCQAMALAEIMNMFPILFRRLKLQIGISILILSLALGKAVGSVWYFIFSYQSQ